MTLAADNTNPDLPTVFVSFKVPEMLPLLKGCIGLAYQVNASLRRSHTLEIRIQVCELTNIPCYVAKIPHSLHLSFTSS